MYQLKKGAHLSLHLLSAGLSLSLSLSQIRLAFTEMLLYLLFKRNISEDCLLEIILIRACYYVHCIPFVYGNLTSLKCFSTLSALISMN